METIHLEGTAAKHDSRRKEIFKSLAVLAVGLAVSFGAERLAHGEEDCVARYEAMEFTISAPGCFEDLVGIDPLKFVTND